MNTLIITTVAVLTLWSLYGYFGSRVEQATYTVIKKGSGYEIRNYPSHIVAQTVVTGTYSDSMRQGFTIVAGYIFGGNTKKESIAMTSPVTMQNPASEKIAMTSPVLVSNEGSSRIISFGMPKSYTLETLPKPTDTRVNIVEVPEKKYALIRFAGYRTNARIQKMEKVLLDILSKDKIETVGAPSYAGYNAPGTPPWMTRNEVLIETK